MENLLSGSILFRLQHIVILGYSKGIDQEDVGGASNHMRSQEGIWFEAAAASTILSHDGV